MQTGSSRVPQIRSVCSSGVLDIACFLAVVPYMGWDIFLTAAGFKDIEINSLPSPATIQAQGPLPTDSRSRRFYETHIPGINGRRSIKVLTRAHSGI